VYSCFGVCVVYLADVGVIMFARTYVTTFDSGFVKYLVYVVFVLGRWGSCVLYTLFANKRSPVSVIISKHAKHVCVCVCWARRLVDCGR
jgi:hypothetical protein